MEQKASIFDKQCINKNAFHKNKKTNNIGKTDIRRIVLSKKNSYGKKGSITYFIGYINEADAFPVPLYIKLPQMNEYDKYFNDSKCMNLLVHDTELLKKFNKIWDKISNLLIEGFDSEPVYDNKYIKAKIKIDNNRTNTNFYGNIILEYG